MPKLTDFWQKCILPEILARWYTRKCHIPDILPDDGCICHCRKNDKENTVNCSNKDCPYLAFHESCLAITGPLPRTWYCPHCRKLPQFKKGKVTQKETITKVEQRAITLDKVCTCQARPQPSQRLLECHSVNCKDGHFFHLNCLGYKRMPSNGKTTWVCHGCKANNVPLSSVQQNSSKAPTTCSFYSADNVSGTGNVNWKLENDCTITGTYDSNSERRGPLKKVDDNDCANILSQETWLDCDIIQAPHVCLQKVNPLIEGFQLPTLGPVRNFSMVSSEFVQILHTGNAHWVCVSSVGCLPGMVNLYDSLSHDNIELEVEEQIHNLMGASFIGINTLPVQQQKNGSDCGVFSIAFATCIVYGIKPEKVSLTYPK